MKQVRRVLIVVSADSCRRLPASTTINMVTQARAVVAHDSCMSDTIFMDATGKEFERNPPDTIVVALAADATPETLALNLIPFIDSSIARLTWKVLVSWQRFSWSLQEVPHWVVCDMNRPNVPLFSDDAAALLAGLQLVPVAADRDCGRQKTHARSQGLRVEAARLPESREACA